ncbi:MAG: DNA-binding protein WhiA [Acidaminococcales bacterium]|jgi:DNA-binding protein WhiA|nr:DNA-binding protein WhiA [Acidaminococcales bacterium]
MSFSGDVKNELAHLPAAKPCCRQAELAILLRMGGSVVIRDCRIGIEFSTENAALARRVLQLVKNNFDLPVAIAVVRLRRLKKNNRYLIKLLPSEKTQKFLCLLGIVPNMENSELEKTLLRRSCCRKAFLRGAFLAGGSVSKPTGDYHLEIVAKPDGLAELLLKELKRAGAAGKLVRRKGDCIVYLKEADLIVSFLSLIGAHGALLDFENVRIVKDMRNNVNRVVNCETANLGKTVGAALRQLSAIKYIDEAIGLGKLTPALREAAALRRKYPEANLSELAEFTEGNVGKAGMNHRLRKLLQIARGSGWEL